MIEVWREIVGTERDREPCGRFTYVAEKLIADASIRARVLMAMKEVRGRCFTRDDKHGYRLAHRLDLPGDYLERVRSRLPGLDGTLSLATRGELMPRQEWMTDEQYAHAFHHYWTLMNGKQDPMIGHVPRSALFHAPKHPEIEEFSLPARGVLTGHLVHEPLMSDIAEFLAIAAGAAAHGDAAAAERAVGYLLDAAKTPPLVVRQKDRTHLVLICAD